MEKSLIPKGPLKRNSSIELLRIIAILMVFTMHTIGNSINRGGEIAEYNILIHHIFGAICGVSVTLFILISGYYSITFKLKRFIQIILLTTFYSVLTYLIYVGIGHNSINYSVLAKDILVVPLYDNWFVSCYLVLMLVSPYLNKLLDSLDKHSFKKLLLVLATMISIIPTFFRSCWDSSIVVGGGGKV